jgi:hypothetical protein
MRQQRLASLAVSQVLLVQAQSLRGAWYLCALPLLLQRRHAQLGTDSRA